MLSLSTMGTLGNRLSSSGLVAGIFSHSVIQCLRLLQAPGISYDGGVYTIDTSKPYPLSFGKTLSTQQYERIV